MLTIAPFKGLTYNFHERKDLSTLVAPPYDVISQEEQRAYYQADPHNVIRLILARKEPVIRIGTTGIHGPRILFSDGSPTATS